MTENLVTPAPRGLAIAIQYWEGDEAAALRLARLLADIETKPRGDATLVLARRRDCPMSAAAWETVMYCGAKFQTTTVRSRRLGEGHPDGCFALWAGTMDALARMYYGGHARFDSAFTAEADGCPLRPDWITRLRAAHDATVRAGKRVTGYQMEAGAMPHINGSLIAHLSLWRDRLSLHRTPAGHAWDLFHAAALTSEARPTGWIKNVYSAGNYSAESLEGLSRETAWLSSSKDGSALAWAERVLPIAAVAEAEELEARRRSPADL